MDKAYADLFNVYTEEEKLSDVRTDIIERHLDAIAVHIIEFEKFSGAEPDDEHPVFVWAEREMKRTITVDPGLFVAVIELIARMAKAKVR